MMKKTLLLVALTAMAVTGASAQMLLINEIYPGGGGAGATSAFTRDYIELYNTSAVPFSLSGYALQYSAAGATSDFTNTIVNFGAGSIIGGNDYLTIETGAAGSAGATLPVGGTGSGAGNATFSNATVGLSATAGSVRLINLTGNIVIDLVGYGAVTTATVSGNVKSEGTSATAPTSVAVSIGRTLFADTNVNSADFSSMTPSPNAGTLSVVVPAATGVPEPSTWAAMVGGLGLLGLVLRRRRQTA